MSRNLCPTRQPEPFCHAAHRAQDITRGVLHSSASPLPLIRLAPSDVQFDSIHLRVVPSAQHPLFEERNILPQEDEVFHEPLVSSRKFAHSQEKEETHNYG